MRRGLVLVAFALLALAVIPSPASAQTDYAPSTQVILSGSQTSGTFPSCVATSDDVRCAYQETVGPLRILSVNYSWVDVDTAGIEWRLFVEGREVANPEILDIYVLNSAEEIGSITCSVTSTTEAVYDCGNLTTDQLDGGQPTISIRDRQVIGDTPVSSWELDRVWIEQTGCEFSTGIWPQLLVILPILIGAFVITLIVATFIGREWDLHVMAPIVVGVIIVIIILATMLPLMLEAISCA